LERATSQQTLRQSDTAQHHRFEAQKDSHLDELAKVGELVAPLVLEQLLLDVGERREVLLARVVVPDLGLCTRGVMSVSVSDTAASVLA
jgi:hypothetical protein